MKIQLSSLTYEIVNVNKRITYITDEVLISRHECLFECYTCDINLPNDWLAAHYTRNIFQCILKRPVPSTYYTAQKNLIVHLVNISVISIYV